MKSARDASLAQAPNVELLDFDVVDGALAEVGVVYLHGWGYDKQQMRALGAAVGPELGPSVFPSLRGHGASPSPAWGYSPWDMTADIQRMADCLPAALSFVGFSFGGVVAATAALALGPARVRDLVVIDCSFTVAPESVRSGEGMESTFLKYMFDYTHVLQAVIALGIRTTVLIGADSHVVSAAERAELANVVGPGLELRFLAGDHLSLVERVEPTAALVRDALTTAG